MEDFNPDDEPKEPKREEEEEGDLVGLKASLYCCQSLSTYLYFHLH